MPHPTPPQRTLVAFDVDGTLIRNRDDKVVWQLLNEHYGRDPAAIKRRFSSYMRGDITYTEWVDLDVGGWRTAGATRHDMAQAICAGLERTPGARRAVAGLKQRGYRLAVISGTLDLTLELLFPEPYFEAVYTNRIWFDEQDHIAGWEATPYDMEGKAEALIKLAAEMEIALDATVFVGDNFNDLKAMEACGRPIAFEPKHPDVEDAADHVLRGSLLGVLDLLP